MSTNTALTTCLTVIACLVFGSAALIYVLAIAVSSSSARGPLMLLVHQRTCPAGFKALCICGMQLAAERPDKEEHLTLSCISLSLKLQQVLKQLASCPCLLQHMLAGVHQVHTLVCCILSAALARTRHAMHCCVTLMLMAGSAHSTASEAWHCGLVSYNADKDQPQTYMRFELTGAIFGNLWTDCLQTSRNIGSDIGGSFVSSSVLLFTL